MRLFPRANYCINEDVWSLRVRHKTMHVLMHRAIGGIGIFDCARSLPVGSISYPEGIEEFLPYSMVVSPDGTFAYLFGSDLEDFAIEIDFGSRRSTRLGLVPPGGIFTSAGWFEPNLNVVDVAGAVWELKGREIVRHSDPAGISGSTASVRRACLDYSVLKMNTTADGVCVFGGQGADGLAGQVHVNGTKFFVHRRDSAIDLACYGETLFVCYEMGLEGAGDRLLLAAGPGERFVAVEALDAAGPVLALLVETSPNTTSLRELRTFDIEF